MLDIIKISLRRFLNGIVILLLFSAHQLHAQNIVAYELSFAPAEIKLQGATADLEGQVMILNPVDSTVHTFQLSTPSSEAMLKAALSALAAGRTATFSGEANCPSAGCVSTYCVFDLMRITLQ